MKIVKNTFYFFLIGILFSCSSTEVLTQEQEQQQLNEQLVEIESLAAKTSCTDPSEWTFTAIGNKACGGPTGFIAYSTEGDVQNFLQLVENYSQAQKAFNIKWGIRSDCSVPPSPTGIVCENGKAVLEY